MSLIIPSNTEAIGRVAYVPTAKRELALTKFSLSTTSGTIASLEGWRIKENISDKKFIRNKKIRLSAKNKRRTINILERSQIIIIFFLLNLSAIKPANEDKKAGIILAINGTTAVNSEFPSAVPIWLARATEANNVAQSPKLESEPDHHNIENCDLDNIFTEFILLYSS